MKPPSSLILLPLLLAAQPALADIKPGERCDTEFLMKVVHDFGKGGNIVDADRIGSRDIEGVSFPVLKPNALKTCDAGTWRQLVTPAEPLVWRSPDAKKYWEDGKAAAKSQHRDAKAHNLGAAGV